MPNLMRNSETPPRRMRSYLGEDPRFRATLLQAPIADDWRYHHFIDAELKSDSLNVHWWPCDSALPSHHERRMLRLQRRSGGCLQSHSASPAWRLNSRQSRMVLSERRITPTSIWYSAARRSFPTSDGEISNSC